MSPGPPGPPAGACAGAQSPQTAASARTALRNESSGDLLAEPRRPPMGRRRFVVCGAAALAAGCQAAPAAGGFRETVRFLAFGRTGAGIDRQRIDRIPHASIAAKVGRGPRSLLVLGRADRTGRHWLSADRAAVVTRHGRVVATAGFPENIRATRFRGGDPLGGAPHRLDRPVRYRRTVDLDAGGLYGLPVEATLAPLGAARIEIAGLQLETVLLGEANSAPAADWSFDNRYWVDRIDGFVWKSVQHIARSFPPIEIEVLKPAAA